jgi:hypothetical protein
MKLIMTVILLGFLVSCSQTKTTEEAKERGASQTVEPAAPDFRIIEAQSEPDTLKGSIKARATGTIGNVNVTIDYYSPAVRERMIWGGLVPYDNVWVTGAHRATSIEFSGNVVIGGLTIQAGKYGLFTIPGKNEWVIIVNKNWDQHLADKYDPKDDVVRVKVKPEVEDQKQERLRYVIESEGTSSGEIVIYWDSLEVSLPVGL